MKRPRVWNIRGHMVVLAAICLILAAVTWFIQPVAAYILIPCALAYGVYILVRLRGGDLTIRVEGSRVWMTGEAVTVFEGTVTV